MLHLPLKRRPLWFRGLHAAVLALVLLASVRSLIPGLCATATAANARTAEQAEMRSAMPACCAARLAREATAPAFREIQDGPAPVECAFCHLVLGLGHAVAQPVVEVTPVDFGAAPLPAVQTLRPALLAAGHASRAPPVCA